MNDTEPTKFRLPPPFASSAASVRIALRAALHVSRKCMCVYRLGPNGIETGTLKGENQIQFKS